MSTPRISDEEEKRRERYLREKFSFICTVDEMTPEEMTLKLSMNDIHDRVYNRNPNLAKLISSFQAHVKSSYLSGELQDKNIDFIAERMQSTLARSLEQIDKDKIDYWDKLVNEQKEAALKEKMEPITSRLSDLETSAYLKSFIDWKNNLKSLYSVYVHRDDKEIPAGILKLVDNAKKYIGKGKNEKEFESFMKEFLDVYKNHVRPDNDYPDIIKKFIVSTADNLGPIQNARITIALQALECIKKQPQLIDPSRLLYNPGLQKRLEKLHADLNEAHKHGRIKDAKDLEKILKLVETATHYHVDAKAKKAFDEALTNAEKILKPEPTLSEKAKAHVLPVKLFFHEKKKAERVDKREENRKKRSL